MANSFNKVLVIILCLLIALSFAGCSKADEGKVNPNPQIENEENAKDTGQEGQNDEGQKDDSDEINEWEEVESRIITDNYPVEVVNYLEANKENETQQALNINNKTYLVLTMGQQSSAGYSIELQKLVLEDGYLKIFAKYEKPGKDSVVATVITYPSLVIETDDIYEGHYEIEYNIEK